MSVGGKVGVDGTWYGNVNGSVDGKGGVSVVGPGVVSSWYCRCRCRW